MQKKILNLTRFLATPAQFDQGVIEPGYDDKVEIAKLLTFDPAAVPSREVVQDRANRLTTILSGYDTQAVMIGGSEFLMQPLTETIQNTIADIEILHPFGTKTIVGDRIKFNHVGFVQAWSGKYQHNQVEQNKAYTATTA